MITGISRSSISSWFAGAPIVLILALVAAIALAPGDAEALPIHCFSIGHRFHPACDAGEGGEEGGGSEGGGSEGGGEEGGGSEGEQGDGGGVNEPEETDGPEPEGSGSEQSQIEAAERSEQEASEIERGEQIEEEEAEAEKEEAERNAEIEEELNAGEKDTSGLGRDMSPEVEQKLREEEAELRNELEGQCATLWGEARYAGQAGQLSRAGNLLDAYYACIDIGTNRKASKPKVGIRKAPTGRSSNGGGQEAKGGGRKAKRDGRKAKAAHRHAH